MLNRPHRLVILRADDGGTAGLQDAGLLFCDAGQGIAEIVLMVEADRGDDGQIWVGDDIRRIPFPAQPDFKDDPVGGIFGHQEDGCGGRGLKESQRQALIGFLDAHKGIEQAFIVDRLAAQLDPLVETHQVRRGVEVDALTGGFAHRLQEGADGSLAIGSCHMDDARQAVLRTAKRLQQALDPRQ